MSESGVIPEVTTRRKLKQARLGVLQRHVLALLEEEPRGLTYLEILASVNDYVLYRGKPWLTTVYTQSLYVSGQISEAAEILMQSLELILDYSKKSADWDASAQQSGSPSNEAHLDQINQAQALLKVSRRFGELIAEDSVEFDKSARIAFYRSLLKQAESVIQILSRIPIIFPRRVFLPNGVSQDVANKALDKTHASLSRTLRLLREHALVDKIEEEVVVSGLYGPQVRVTYAITDEGRRRLGAS